MPYQDMRKKVRDILEKYLTATDEYGDERVDVHVHGIDEAVEAILKLFNIDPEEQKKIWTVLEKLPEYKGL